MAKDERVLGISADHFEQAGAFTGFRSIAEFDPSRLLVPAAYRFEPRSTCETDPSFKQLIPYLVLKCGEWCFQYRRGAAGTEKRLQALRSIGIGGHISEEDAAGGADPYRTGMLRELQEEVEGLGNYQEKLFGLVHDPRTLVGSVHVGVVHLLELEQPTAVAKDQALCEASWCEWTTLLAEMVQFETWSQMVLQQFVQDRHYRGENA
jgi:predicted NUDIX family phosphoesterase